MFGLYLPPVISEPSPGVPPETIISVPVQTAVCNIRWKGALVVLVAVQVFVLGLYLPPLFTSPELVAPPQTIISLLVHTAVALRAAGALVVLVAVQLSVLGLYLPPVLK